MANRKKKRLNKANTGSVWTRIHNADTAAKVRKWGEVSSTASQGEKRNWLGLAKRAKLAD